ncbi:Zap1p KNAG_0E02610 [Huiozyma naganishii CBS 8797]|uniref:C2H2-type domain-containing protein n=1 Tax=Huiozyma naganishii (strain ATCC MYA-139 / BCRC 22969 / CBS 8797 / KCTC 17520 / NBRC 10181 / NCYC 3082 / Yp74L-3) TaxID=1071383 RepID=J7R6P9_HUIN7|nr:hypothetical protein KNAG_0E02610 [Kazachstania naganishii CBS 8797]CCK70520.1 hypothetical protein KNAG_0E02610 [Kazachstania naganishii CBS 8797]
MRCYLRRRFLVGSQLVGFWVGWSGSLRRGEWGMGCQVDQQQRTQQWAEEGVVHGHIHNYNNVTYIHGHVHRNGRAGEDGAGEGGASGPLSPEHSLLLQQQEGRHALADECENFEFFDFHGDVAFTGGAPYYPLVPLPNGGTAGAGVSSLGQKRLLEQSCRPSASAKRVKSEGARLAAGSPAQGDDCSCAPQVLEVCCDVDHMESKDPCVDAGAVESTTAKVPPFVQTTTTTNSRCPPWNYHDELLHGGAVPSSSQLNATMKQFIDLSCDLDCASLGLPPPERLPNNSGSIMQNSKDQVAVDFFDRYCQLCENNEAHQQHVYGDNDAAAKIGKQHAHAATVPLENQLKTADMKILEDLCNISSLYEAPLAKHMNHTHHNHLEEPTASGGNTTENLNLLGGITRTESSEPRENVTQQHSNGHNNNYHHHHRVHLHPHIKDPTLSQQTIPLTPNSLLTAGGDDPRNTIDFNWIFKKNEPDALHCRWDQCSHTSPFENLIDLQKHMFMEHIPQSTSYDIDDYFCNWQDCHFQGQDVCSLVNHINDNHGINFNIKVPEPKVKPEKQPTAKLIHTDMRNEHDPVECKWGGCHLKFGSCKELNDHLENDHLPRGQSQYTCSWAGCGKTFTQRQKIARHLKVHTRYKPYKCPQCQKCFSSDETLKQHLRIHSGEKPYHCDICGKRFAISSSLKIHVRTHTGEKPLQCAVCGKRFIESSNLNKHMKTHEKGFQCSKCHKKFPNKGKMELHSARCK